MMVSRIEDRFGNFVTYTYAGNRLTAITASDGRSITLSYNANGHVTSASDGTRT
jgi:YD repeat-containing protein